MARGSSSGGGKVLQDSSNLLSGGTTGLCDGKFDLNNASLSTICRALNHDLKTCTNNSKQQSTKPAQDFCTFHHMRRSWIVAILGHPAMVYALQNERISIDKGCQWGNSFGNSVVYGKTTRHLSLSGPAGFHRRNVERWSSWTTQNRNPPNLRKTSVPSTICAAAELWLS